jgi:NRPS condensation-like uncharacterized protein
MSNLKSKNFWLKLDNAAKLYPAIQNAELTAVFRITAVLTDRVKIKPLQEAVSLAESRFPYFRVTLKTGVFWYYLESSDLKFKVLPDINTPCRAFGKNELLFRILVKENRINVEFSHILTDGSGAFSFLKYVLNHYFRICGIEGIVSKEIDLKPDKEEYEDAYNRYFKRVNVSPVMQPKAFHLPFKNPVPFNILTATIPLRQLIATAKEFEVSVTEYLTAVYLSVLQKLNNKTSGFKKRRLLRIQVPINLRNVFPSKTMRNFSLFVMPGIDLRLGAYTFEEIVKMVHYQMRLETDKKLIQKTMSRNVAGEKNFFVRNMPLFIKSFVISQFYAAGANQYSGVVTNYGSLKLPIAMERHIERFYFIPPPPNKHIKVSAGIVGFKGNLLISFGSITASKELERLFFSVMIQQGISVKILK